MTASDFVVSEEAPLPRNPLRPWGFSRIGVGATYVVAGGFVAYVLLPEAHALISAAEYGLVSLPAVFDGVRTVIAVALCIRGVRMMSDAIGSVTRLVIPPAAPASLDTGDAEAALVRRELGAYRSRAGMASRFVAKWFPGRMPVLTGRLRTIADAGLAEVGRVAQLAVYVAAGFTAITVLPGLRDTFMAGVLPPVPWTFLLLYAAAALLHVVVVVRALPATAPRAEVRAFRASAQGGGDPSHIAHGLQRELAAMAPAGGLPNRASETGFVLERGAVRDAGTFEGRLFVESQPRFTAMADAPSARTLVVAGSIAQVLALFWWLGGADAPATLTTGANAGVAATLLYAAQLLAGSLLGAIGTRMVASGGELQRGFRFESLAVMLDVRGTVARSHLRVGRGMNDSIESDNLVVRSDAYVSGYCAALLTECREPTGPRCVVGMIANDRTAEVELIVQRFMWRFERQPATIAQVNLRDAGLLEVMQANLSVEAQRTLARSHLDRVGTPLPAARLQESTETSR